MPITHKARYSGDWFSSNGRYYRFRIYDKNYTPSTVIPIKVGGGGVKIKYDTKGQDKFSPIVASKCSISLVVEDNTFGLHFRNFIKELRETYEEGDATIVIWNTGSTSDRPIWSGIIKIDLSSKEDVSATAREWYENAKSVVDEGKAAIEKTAVSSVPEKDLPF